jgi:hypothetical protein
MRRGLLWRPRHAWRGVSVDRSGLWAVVSLGWWTVDVLPGPIATRLVGLLAELRRARAPGASTPESRRPDD